MTTNKKQYKRVLTIAGSDSGGGAGIQADIKTISACGCYASSAITAVTVQNTLGVEGVHPIPLDILRGQIEAVLSDIGTDAVKIGMLHSSAVVEVVADVLRKFGVGNIVLDPVMVSTSGHRLIEDSAIDTIRRELLPLARVITPNIPEAEILAGTKIDSNAQLPEVAHALAEATGCSVLMKAGHLEEEELVDYLYNAEEEHIVPLRSQRITTPNTHGTGCTLSSALASHLALGLSLDEAATAAKSYIEGAIRSGADYVIGHGHGPVDHFWKLKA